MKRLITIAFLFSSAFAQVRVSINAGNVVSGSVGIKNFEVQGVRKLSTLSKYPLLITSLNYRYHFVYAGYGKEGLSYGITGQWHQYVVNIGMTGKYGLATLGVTNIKADNRPSWITKNDLWIMALQVIAGGADGMREQVLYHPNELFAQHPFLNRQWWDSRISWTNKDHQSKWLVSLSDANHFFKSVYTYADLVSIGLSAAEIKNFSWKNAVKKIVMGVVARKVGFYTVYNLHFNN